MFFMNIRTYLGVVWAGLGEVPLLLADEAHREPVGVLSFHLRLAVLARVLQGSALKQVID